VNGFATERYGYRKVILASLFALVGITAIFFTAPNIQTLLAGEILAGVPWGVFMSIAISYACEVCPVALRGYLTTYGNFCWGWGQLIAIGVIKSMFDRTDEWAYRIPYGLMVSFKAMDMNVAESQVVDVVPAPYHRCLLCS